MSVQRYKGRFGPAEAERLLWRAGFGPRPGESKRLARRGLRKAVRELTRPRGNARLRGPEPRDDDGLPLAPGDAWGHDHLWWLDRMVRSDQPLVERMALVWHDWFATADVGQDSLNLAQNELFRSKGRGRFDELLLEVTRDPAMLIWLSGTDNRKGAPNENYARELMELFTLGAGAGYTESDVREQARALTGWDADYRDGVGWHNFRFDPDRHDQGDKRIFGRSGRFDWEGACRLCLEHPEHPQFFIDRLWSYFIGEPADRRTRAALIEIYTEGYEITPLLEAILMHPRLYEGPRMVKPPIVTVAGVLRARGKGVDRNAWVWMSVNAGQRLFQPPNVAGWDEERWLDTATMSGRWRVAASLVDDARPDEDSYDPREKPAKAVRKAIRFWGNPKLTPQTKKELLRFARQVERVATEEWQQRPYRALRQNALRMLIASSPDIQTS